MPLTGAMPLGKQGVAALKKLKFLIMKSPAIKVVGEKR